jgi:hypothetical protein
LFRLIQQLACAKRSHLRNRTSPTQSLRRPLSWQDEVLSVKCNQSAGCSYSSECYVRVSELADSRYLQTNLNTDRSSVRTCTGDICVFRPFSFDSRCLQQEALASSLRHRNVSRLKREENEKMKVKQGNAKVEEGKVRRKLLSLFLSSALFRSCRSHVIDFQPSFTTTYQIRQDETSLN